MSAKGTEDRLVTVETRLAYQDEAIETLNATVTAQWAKIEAVVREVAGLRDRLREAETGAGLTAGDELPPHY